MIYQDFDITTGRDGNGRWLAFIRRCDGYNFVCEGIETQAFATLPVADEDYALKIARQGIDTGKLRKAR